MVMKSGLPHRDVEVQRSFALVESGLREDGHNLVSWPSICATVQAMFPSLSTRKYGRCQRPASAYRRLSLPYLNMGRPLPTPHANVTREVQKESFPRFYISSSIHITRPSLYPFLHSF